MLRSHSSKKRRAASASLDNITSCVKANTVAKKSEIIPTLPVGCDEYHNYHTNFSSDGKREETKMEIGSREVHGTEGSCTTKSRGNRDKQGMDEGRRKEGKGARR